jgi:hypothetical protein
MMAQDFYSEISVNFYLSTPRHIPENGSRRSYRWQDIISAIVSRVIQLQACKLVWIFLPANSDISEY